jgi:integrase
MRNQTLVALLGLPGLRIFEACAAGISDTEFGEGTDLPGVAGWVVLN